jgi:CRP-like cAMP-binding protein
MGVDAGLVDGLGRLALFADLDRGELETLAAMVDEASFREGEWIVRRGQTDVGLHVIVEGEVSVVVDDDELAVFPRGGFFGEISALLGEPAVADIVARSPVRCLVVPVARVEGFLLANPTVMLRMLQTEARRLKTADESRA